MSIHFITPDIDDGEVLFQREIHKDITMTGQELYDISIVEIIDLFKNHYCDIVKLNYHTKKQDCSKSTFHFAKEIKKHSEIKLEKDYKALELINIMRARNFPNNPSSFFYLNNKKYYVNIVIQRFQTVQ